MNVIFCDIIGGLHGKLMEHIVEQIFGQLDYQSLANAEMVSKIWRDALLGSGDIWRNLLKRNVHSGVEDMWRELYFHLDLQAHHPSVRKKWSSLQYRRICYKIASAKERVRHSAWRQGLAHMTKRPTLDYGSGRYRVRCSSFAMDEFRIATGITDGSIQIWNRRTLLQEKMLKDERDGVINQFRVLAIKEQIVVSQTATSITVWDINQEQPMKVVEHEPISPRFLTLKHGLLISGSNTATGGQISVAVRQFLSPSDLPVQHLYQPAVSQSARQDICHMNFDRRFIVLVMSQYALVEVGNGCNRDGYEIQIRSTPTFDLLRTKRIPPGRLAAKFHYSNGWIVHTSTNYSIEILDAETLGHRITIPNSEPIFSLNMNLGYVVTQHVSTMRLWDLDGALALDSTTEPRESDLLLRSFDDPWHGRSWCSIDDIQIVKFSTSFHNWGCFNLVVRDFLTGLACKAKCCAPFAPVGPLPATPHGLPLFVPSLSVVP